LLHVTDADGNRDSDYNVTTSVHSFRSDTNEYGVTITIHPAWMPGAAGAARANPPKPAKVVWDVPVEVTDVSYPLRAQKPAASLSSRSIVYQTKVRVPYDILLA
jgi:hypothetical protein